MTVTSEPPVLGAAEMLELYTRSADLVILDVRSPGEYAAAHIEGSVNVPLDLIEQRNGEIAARIGGPVVLLCAQGVRSARAARLLAAAGARDLHVLGGGLGTWESAGGEVSRGRGSWAMDRQVRLVAGSVVLASVLASTRRPAVKWLAAAMGAGLTYSALSNTCAMARVLGYLPYNRRTPAFDLNTALDALSKRDH